MSGLIPEMSITEFRRLSIANMKRLQSCEIMADGEYLFTFINPSTGYIKSQAEAMGEVSNSVGGETLQDIQEGVLVGE